MFHNYSTVHVKWSYKGTQMRYKMEPSYITEWNLIMQQKGPN